MATIISADDLNVGDVYRSRGSLRVLEVDAYQVVNLRTVKTVETYKVVEAVNLRTGLAATIHLRNDVEVARLEITEAGELAEELATMADGLLVVVRHDGRFWT